jgi:hypothetical protein
LLHQLGVMVARIVEKDMDEHHQRIKCLGRFEQRDRRTILRAEKAAANHAPSESTDPQKARNFARLFNESWYMYVCTY